MGLRRPPAALIWPGLPLLYLLLPGHPLGLFAGPPLSPLAAGLGLAIALAAWCGAGTGAPFHRAVGLLLVGAVGLRLLLAGAALPYGLAAEYRAGADSRLPPERSTEWRIDGATRVDRSLDFVADEFPLHFINELRFNYFRPSEPRRDLLPFSATWRGWVAIPDEGRRCYQLEANGTATLRLGNQAPAGIQRAARVEARELCAEFGVGPQALELRYERPQNGAPYLRLSELEADSHYVPIPPARLLRQATDPNALARDQWLGRLAWVLDATVLSAALALGVGRLAARLRPPGQGRSDAVERLLLSLAMLAAFAEALLAYRHFEGKAAILSGGDDWLSFEHSARDVLLHGPLMNGGQPLGQGETFYQQPLYCYFLAGLHALLGESLHGPLVAQYVLVALVGVLTYFLAREVFGRPAAVAAFALFWIFRYLIFNQVAGLLLSENLLAVLVPAMLLLLARWQRTWRRANLVGGGVLLGLAVLARSTPLLFLPPAMLLVGFAQLRKFGQRRAALGAAALLFAVTMSATGLVAARNFIVAGRPVPLPESASTNLWKVHRPSAKVDLSGIGRDPLYNRLGLDRQTREVLEFARQDPLGYGWTLAVMGLYAIGFTGPALETSQVQYELVALTALYLAGILFVPAARRGPAWLIHAFVVTHFLPMMFFLSHQYGFRLPLPMYGPMIAAAGATVTALLGRLAPSPSPPALSQGERGPRAAVLTATVVLALAWAARGFVQSPNVEAQVFGLGGDAGPAARAAAASPEAWRADRIYFGGTDRRSREVAYLPGLAYRDMQWLDASQALVWPAEGKRGVLVLASSVPTPLMEACWPAGTREALVGGSSGGATERVVVPLPAASERRCLADDRRRASFGGLIDLLGSEPIHGNTDHQAELRVAWRVVQPPSFRLELVAERLDAAGSVLESVAIEPYLTSSWERGELIVARAPLPTSDLGSASQLAVGFARRQPPTRLTIDDPLSLYGKLRVPLGE